jgi:hypothetical protein
MRNRWKTRIINIHTSVENERWTLQIESEGDSVGTDGNTFSDTIMVVDFVTVILQLGGGGEELTEVNSGVGATVVDTGINQSLERKRQNYRQANDRKVPYLVSSLECQTERWVKVLGLLLANTKLQRIEQVNI